LFIFLNLPALGLNLETFFSFFLPNWYFFKLLCVFLLNWYIQINIPTHH
jgi:hypothetical protein